jgi:hypothetical protein
MLTLFIEPIELFNEETQTFQTLDGFELELEHSLVSLSKWESITKVPFLSKTDKTPEDIRLYIEAMIISPIYPPNAVGRMTQSNIDQVNAYLESSESATTFGTMPEVKGRGETITSELIYYWMVAFNIPFECERWHLNRLFSLIRICNIKNTKPKKMTARQLAERNARLNEERKQKYQTRG